jgi:hypothetical protein
MARNDLVTTERSEAVTDTVGSNSQSFLDTLSVGEKELMSELLYALRTVRYGSIVLTLHEGRIVEIHKTERIRRNGNKESSAKANHE